MAKSEIVSRAAKNGEIEPARRAAICHAVPTKSITKRKSVPFPKVERGFGGTLISKTGALVDSIAMLFDVGNEGNGGNEKMGMRWSNFAAVMPKMQEQVEAMRAVPMIEVG